MAKKRVKKRTHVGAAKGGLPSGQAAATAAGKPGTRSPKSMVIRVGASEVGHSVSQLVKDVRRMMEPDTASRLKERRSNKLRDYVSMAGPLGVTHLMLFSRSEQGNLTLRIALTPRGPTLHYRVLKYSLAKDVHKSQRRPKTAGEEYLRAPLMVMNNFASKAGEGEEDKHDRMKDVEKLTTSIFQSLFPAINPTNTPLDGIKRVLLADRKPQDPASDARQVIVDLRHYAIETKTSKSVPKALRRLDAAEKLTHSGQKRKRSALPNLGKLNDVSEYLLDPHAADGFTSGSESEPETDAEVEITTTKEKKVQRRKGQKEGADGQSNPRSSVEKKAIKLHELGPRLKLRLTKIEEGLCSGKVMWHEYIHKTKEEVKQMDKRHEQKRQEKERRKAEQRANVEKKKAEKAARKAKGEEVEESEDEGMLSDDDEWDDADEMEDDEYHGPDADAGASDEEMEKAEDGEQ
ncbi:hypothetical protein AC579_9403 [Pseudocercospora musae]|uniref:Brix domain-containing protein n=1 Tax=Pseudocercospora musae TaxID=113226 RepID=A0A139HHE8_9PEZI|nr:hypothetical protein AC579_9403 [Pseudocercospora musae]